jgi:low affinity Fe/Cu permease
MADEKRNGLYCFFDKFSNRVTKITGSPIAFIVALIIVIVWAVTGPVFGFSDTWQLVINTGTTIITFLMVFVIQQSQNKDTIALHLKLNELIAATETASNRLIDSEDLTEEELATIKKYYVKLSNLSERKKDLFSTHSIDEAHKNDTEKEETQRDKKTIKK